MHASMKDMVLNFQYLQRNPVTLERKTRKKMTSFVKVSLVTRAFSLWWDEDVKEMILKMFSVW